MMTRIPIPVAATHDLRRGRGPLIKRGTPGELTGVTRATPGRYTVTFWPYGPTGITVVVDNLTRLDVKEA